LAVTQKVFESYLPRESDGELRKHLGSGVYSIVAKYLPDGYPSVDWRICKKLEALADVFPYGNQQLQMEAIVAASEETILQSKSMLDWKQEKNGAEEMCLSLQKDLLKLFKANRPLV
jgi:hypothetical protein